MFVSAWSKSAMEVVYRDEAGGETVRSGGSRSWRNCNPGNIIKGSFAEAHGAIGGDTRFAIFPDEETGLDAIEALFRSRSYASLSVRDAIFRYAPPSDGNDSGAYLAAVAGAVGVDPQTILDSLDSGQLARLAQAIQRHEGWKPGTIEPIQGLAASPLGAALAPAAAGFALSGDAARIPRLIELGADPEQCREIRERAFAAMTRIYGKPTARNACACTLSMFLRASGVDVEVEYGAGNLARILEKERGWQRVPVGQQQPGDVGVTQDRLPPAGADHIYLVVARLDADRMLIADNQQASAPHPRWASGQTPTAYFLRAPGDGAGFAPFGLTTSDEIVTDDEDTNGLLIRFDESGAPL